MGQNRQGAMTRKYPGIGTSWSNLLWSNVLATDTVINNGAQ